MTTPAQWNVGSRPKALYRYMSYAGQFKEWVDDIIKHSRLFQPSPRQFNDPFDCHPTFKVSDRDAWYKKMVASRSSLESRRERRKALKEFRAHDLWKDPKMLRRYEEDWLEQLVYKTGILSLSEIKDSILMWSHYSDKHTGVCLAFDGASPFFANCRKVHYSADFPIIDLSDDDNGKHVRQALLTKSEAWRYEGEWRLLGEPGESVGKVEFPKDALLRIIFGALTLDTEAESLMKLAHQHMPHITFSRMTIAEKQFSLHETAVP